MLDRLRPGDRREHFLDIRIFRLKRWFLIRGNRYSVIIILLLFTFLTMLLVGTIWTFQMQQLLTESSAVQSLLNTLLSGIILLVSIVVSTSAIVLSYDITSLDAQSDRVEATMEFRREVERLTDGHESPTDPESFLRAITGIIEVRAEQLAEPPTSADREFERELQAYTQSVMETVSDLNESLDSLEQQQLGALWEGLDVNYGPHLNRSDRFTLDYEDQFTTESREQFDELVSALHLFAMGKEYFKTLYYAREISKLSRALLLISLPTILIVASATLAIDARLLPDFWLFGLPPLLTFVSAIFTVSLAPFATLTAYMLRVATIAKRTASAGPFTLVE